MRRKVRCASSGGGRPAVAYGSPDVICQTRTPAAQEPPLQTVTALRSLILEPGLLHLVQGAAGGKALGGCDLLALDGGAGHTQDRMAACSRCRVHAPHWATPQPYFVPVRPTASSARSRIVRAAFSPEPRGGKVRLVSRSTARLSTSASTPARPCSG